MNADISPKLTFQAERSARGQRPAEEGMREGAHGQGAEGRVQDGAAHRQGNPRSITLKVYRASLVLVDLGWVDFDLCVPRSTIWPSCLVDRFCQIPISPSRVGLTV